MCSLQHPIHEGYKNTLPIRPENICIIADFGLDLALVNIKRHYSKKEYLVVSNKQSIWIRSRLSKLSKYSMTKSQYYLFLQ